MKSEFIGNYQAHHSGSVDEELLLRNGYLVAEHRVLRNQMVLPQLSVGGQPVLCQNSAPAGIDERTAPLEIRLKL